jgi:hypothetical protein
MLNTNNNCQEDNNNYLECELSDFGFSRSTMNKKKMNKEKNQFVEKINHENLTLSKV